MYSVIHAIYVESQSTMALATSITSFENMFEHFANSIKPFANGYEPFSITEQGNVYLNY